MKLLKIELKIEKLLEMLDDLVGKGENSEGELKDRDNAVMARSPRKGDAKRLLRVPCPQRRRVWGRFCGANTRNHLCKGLATVGGKAFET